MTLLNIYLHHSLSAFTQEIRSSCECIALLVQRTKDLDTAELLEHLPALQQLLFRVLGCQVIFNSEVGPVVDHN